MSMCLYFRVYMTYVCMYWKRPEEGVGFLGASYILEVSGGYELPDKGARNWTLVLGKSSKSSWLPSNLFSLQTLLINPWKKSDLEIDFRIHTLVLMNNPKRFMSQLHVCSEAMEEAPLQMGLHIKYEGYASIWRTKTFCMSGNGYSRQKKWWVRE